jgi:Zn-dependent protease
MRDGINVLLALMIVGSFLLALSLHEVGHAVMARWLGDRTPQAEGRQSLSLRSHIDPLGLLICVILAFQPILAFPVGFGWGKPVKADPWKMRVGANLGLFTVAIAGPLFSLLIGLLFAVIVRFSLVYLPFNPLTLRLLQLLVVFASVNICLTLFNLIPLYPLDGYQIVYTLLPSKQAVQFAKSAPYGPFIILILFFFLPFLARLSGVGGFFLFQLAYYILDGSLNLIALVVGPLSNSLSLIQTLYAQ